MGGLAPKPFLLLPVVVWSSLGLGGAPLSRDRFGIDCNECDKRVLDKNDLEFQKLVEKTDMIHDVKATATL